MGGNYIRKLKRKEYIAFLVIELLIAVSILPNISGLKIAEESKLNIECDLNELINCEKIDICQNQKISINSSTTFNSIFNFGFEAVLFANVEASFDVVYAIKFGGDNVLIIAFLRGENGDVKLEPRIGIFQHDVHVTGSIVDYGDSFPPYYYDATFKGTALYVLVGN